MKKNRIAGWMDVFSFTLRQTGKSKSFVSTTIVMSLILFAVLFGANVIGANTDLSKKEKSESKQQEEKKKLSKFVDEIYLLNESGYELSIEKLQAYMDKKYSGASIVAVGTTHDAMLETMETTTDSMAYLHVSISEEGMQANMFLPKETKSSKEDAEKYLKRASNYLKRWKSDLAGLSKEQRDFLASDITTYVTSTDSQGMAKEMLNSFVPMFGCLVLYMCIVLYGQMVGSSIATEKSSKVMELLLTSVRPFAIIIGKVLGMLVLALSQLLIFVAAGVVGNMAGEMAGTQINPGYSNIVRQILTEYDLLSALHPVNIIMAILVFILGFTFFCTLAGLVGATVSRGEDLASAMSVFQGFAMVGFFLAYMPNIGMGSAKGIVEFAKIFPLSSPFILPAQILLGNINAVSLLVSIALLLVCVLILVWIVSKIYEMIILYNGNRVGLKEMRQFMKLSKAEKN